MSNFLQFEQLVSLFFGGAGARSHEDWIREAVGWFDPRDPHLPKLISELQYMLDNLSDEQLKQAWQASRPVLLIDTPATVRGLLERTLNSLKGLTDKDS